jgi:hypothetical protein
MSWYTALKDAFTIGGRLRDADLEHKLVKVQSECLKLSEENGQLKQEITELKKQLQVRGEMKYHLNVYWKSSEDGSKDEGPFCPKCFDGDRKLARLAERPEDSYWRCHVCSQLVMRPGTRSRPSRADSDFDSLFS